MTAASATPQQIRDRLLQAIDGQSNIRNMMAVLEVISHLEKCPITKEALEETRLGKLINDVRKKTKDEDLAKRAKKLLRTWQKLIEPEQNDPAPKEFTGTNGGAFASRIEYSPQTVTSISGKTAPELKIRNDFHNCNYPKVEGSGHRKRKGGQQEAQHLPAKISKTSAFEQHSIATLRPTNGTSGSPDTHLSAFDNSLHHQSDKDSTDSHELDRTNKVPVNAVRPRPSSPAVSKPPSASLLLKTAVLQQQQAKKELPASGGVQQPPKSPCSSAVNPKCNTPETLGRWPPSGLKPAISSPPLSPKVPSDSLGSGSPSRSPNPALLSSCHVGGHPADVGSDWQVDVSSGHDDGGRMGSKHDRGSSLQSVTDVPDGIPSADVAKQEADGGAHGSERKRKKYRPRDYTVNLVGQHSGDSRKPAKLKDRKLTFDPVTGQIKPLTQKESQPREEAPVATEPESHWTDAQKQSVGPAPNSLQQTNWKELSRNEIIQSYLSLRSNVLTSSGAPTGPSFLMSEFLKQTESRHAKEGRETHVLVPNAPASHLPGVTREVTKEDLDRLHSDHWPGVNGCYDTKGSWHDWTDCISLAPHGDEGQLHILPYVCLD